MAALVLVGAYLVGSIPFGILVTRAAGAADPRSIGSGNIGATNVLRTGRKGLAALTLLLDGGKGAAAVLIVEAIEPGFGPLAAVGAFFGHVFPLWLGFKGGKGVATLLGVVLALCWQAGLVALAVWLLATLLTRYSSIGGMSAAIAAPVAAAFFFRADLVIILLVFALVLVWRHGANIARLLEGTEPRVGRSADA
ncbi:glycerol-3-phosphate 1-O-acyltransferase PlsY [Sphingomonas nostoxanthinifaciens]|nr:glycerol-3-phosphate 1-O-acyltransferase PlsY [Sphingomonas nostoxanthinifaciens]